MISKDVSSLTEGTHTYTITAVDDEGLSTSNSVGVVVTPEITDIIPPAVPTGLIAISTGTTTINVNWADNSESDLKEYKVYRSTSSGFTPSISTLVVTVTVNDYADSGLTSATTYYYKVIAIDTSDNPSDSSSQASATTETGSTVDIITAPFNHDGAGEYSWKIAEIPNFLNCWNLQSLTINGVDFTNKWVGRGDLPPKVDGYYVIHYVANVAWSHLEIK